MKLQWTERSRRDLDAIERFIARDDPDAARRWVARLEVREHYIAVLTVFESHELLPTLR